MDAKKKKIWIMIAIVALVAILAWWYFASRAQKDEELLSTEPKNPLGKVKNAVASLARTYTPVTAFDAKNPIKKGMEGPQIAQLQRYLNEKFKAKLTVDGKWWDKTQEAFMKAKFMTEDGKQQYTTLTKRLYDTLGLANYSSKTK